MKIYPNKLCGNCLQYFTPTGPAAKYCKVCALEFKKLSRKLIDQRSNLKKGRKVGVGKGKANLKGLQDSQFKNGITYFHKIRKQIKIERKSCERCNKNLEAAALGQWCTHHKDHNRNNNVYDNFELLCKRCHQREHKCWINLLKGATTIS